MALLILPNQLFENNKLIDENLDHHIYLFEHSLYFTKYPYHKMKLILHRSTMKYYFDYCKKTYKTNNITYLEYDYDITSLFKKHKEIKLYNPIDHDIMKQLNKLSKKHSVKLTIFENPNFINSMKDLQTYIQEKNIFIHHNFYVWSRLKHDILLNNKKPIGGKWSYDVENRNKFPPDFKDSMKFIKNKNKYVQAAIKYVNDNFPNNIGNTSLYLPIDFPSIKQAFRTFLKTRLNCFGKYQDAQSSKIVLGCHSLLSPLINLGMLQPKFIIEETEKYYKEHNKSLDIADVEGYIRQLFWREYVMFVYMFKYKEINDANYFKNDRNLDKTWYTGETNIPPIDHLINKVKDIGYLHHIERLMFMGNFMLLSEIKPTQVYEWFMIMFIDSYAWVMMPNIYGMSQYSAGPEMMTRPYFSSSNYLDKMSLDFRKKRNVYPKININNTEYEWFEIWDALYYNFINKHKLILSKNYSTATGVMHLNNLTLSEKMTLLRIAKYYLNNYNK
jgi:deoxyribodipyrimidine photolyase-related protein